MLGRSSSSRSLPRALVLAAGGLGGWLGTAGALAQGAPKDAQAEKALSAAMDGDYLETRFDQAERKLRAAIDACGEAGCSPGVKARLFIGLGSVLAGGKKQLEDARDAFSEALRLDPQATLDPDVSSAEITFAFERARPAAKPAPAGPEAGPTLKVTPPPEQRVRTPLPLYADLDGARAARTKQVVVWYQPPDDDEYRQLVLKKLRSQGIGPEGAAQRPGAPGGEQRFGINIPCGDLDAEGELRYYLAALDAEGGLLATAGTREAPLTTQIKASITSEPPHWPGFAPPATCAAVVDDGPKQCLDDRQCNAGLACVGGACTKPKAAAPTRPDVRRDWVGLTFSPDVAALSGDGVCSVATQEADHVVCLRSDKSRYDGTPTPGVANNVNFGFALATLRIAVAYDRLVLDNLTIGARAGFAARGTTDGGASFLPLHLEARAQYYLVPRPFEGLGVRPFALAAAGVAQVDAPVDVEVLEDAAACGANPDDAASPCTQPGRSGRVEPRVQTLTAHKQAGQGFVSLGAGVGYAPLDAVSLNLALRASITLPVVIAVLSPEIGVSIGF